MTRFQIATTAAKAWPTGATRPRRQARRPTAKDLASLSVKALAVAFGVRDAVQENVQRIDGP